MTAMLQQKVCHCIEKANDQGLAFVNRGSVSGTQKFAWGAPDVMKEFSGLARAASKPEALDSKTKELIALAIAVAVRCDPCIAFHAQAAVNQGAFREEVMEAMGLAIYMAAGPSVMYASQAVEAHARD